jgi:hypothetical protein
MGTMRPGQLSPCGECDPAQALANTGDVLPARAEAAPWLTTSPTPSHAPTHSSRPRPCGHPASPHSKPPTSPASPASTPTSAPAPPCPSVSRGWTRTPPSRRPRRRPRPRKTPTRAGSTASATSCPAASTPARANTRGALTVAAPVRGDRGVRPHHVRRGERARQRRRRRGRRLPRRARHPRRPVRADHPRLRRPGSQLQPAGLHQGRHRGANPTSPARPSRATAGSPRPTPRRGSGRSRTRGRTPPWSTGTRSRSAAGSRR